MRLCRPVANVTDMPIFVQRGDLRGRVYARREAVLGKHSAELQCVRRLGERDDLCVACFDMCQRRLSGLYMYRGDILVGNQGRGQ
jgi:hypothetical protein